MKKTGHHITFTAQDIQRYHAGAMSMQERHALEKAALDDPFLADALEGYTHTSTPEEDLAALQQRLEDKTTQKKRRLYIPIYKRPFIRVAALLLLLAGAGWSIYQFSLAPDREPIAKQEIDKVSTSSTPSDTVLQQSVTDSAIQSKQTLQEKNYLVSAPTIVQQPKKAPVARKRTTDENSVAAAMRARVAVNEAMKAKELQATEDQQIAIEKNASLASRASISPTLNTFKGQIVDPSGNPVPYASITVNGKQNATTTNTQGQFSVTTPDSVVNATIAAVGFQSNRVNFMNPAQEQKIVLNEASGSLQEVVVTGLGTRRAKKAGRPSDANTKVEVEELEPEGGWSGFNDYITQNLHIPEEVIRKQLKGEVELSFEVDKDGEPVNIKVIKSLCTTCDQEAIRLLKGGPDWKKKKKKAGKVTIRF